MRKFNWPSFSVLCEIEKPIGLRDRALLEMLYSTGMRRLEIVRLKLYDSLPSSRTTSRCSLRPRGEPFSRDHLTYAVKERIDAAQLGKSGACQLFRHTMATHAAEAHAMPTAAERSAAEREDLHAALEAEDEDDGG